MKYKIINTDLYLNGRILSEGSVVELSGGQEKGLMQYLIPIDREQNHNHSDSTAGNSQSTEGKEKQNKRSKK